jgi:pentatricopeptide repeat protein
MQAALEDLAQNLLNLSDCLSALDKEKQSIGRALRKTQPTSGPRDVENQTVKAKETAILRQSLERLDRKIKDARKRNIPFTSFHIRLKRLHGQIPRRPSTKAGHELNRDQDNMELKALLALPTSTLLADLANYILTASMPFTEESFLLMIDRLTRHRYTSAARSAYRSMVSAGFAPDSPKAVVLLIRMAVVSAEKREFYRLEKLVRTLDTHNTLVNGALIVGYLKFSRIEIAKHYLAQMATDGHFYVLAILTRFVEYCGAQRDWILGKRMWEAIEAGQAQGRFSIDRFAYRQIWRMCRRCGQVSAAALVLKGALRNGFRPKDIILRGRMNPVRPSNKSTGLSDYYTAFFNASEERAQQNLAEFVKQSPPQSVPNSSEMQPSPITSASSKGAPPAGPNATASISTPATPISHSMFTRLYSIQKLSLQYSSSTEAQSRLWLLITRSRRHFHPVTHVLNDPPPVPLRSHSKEWRAPSHDEDSLDIIHEYLFNARKRSPEEAVSVLKKLLQFHAQEPRGMLVPDPPTDVLDHHHPLPLSRHFKNRAIVNHEDDCSDIIHEYTYT